MKPGEEASTGIASPQPDLSVSEERSFAFIFPVLIALSCLPLWITAYLPMTDLPQHLALINILHHLKDPAFRFHEYFTLRTALTPYIGYYWTVNLLAYFVPIEVANRLFLSAYVAGLAGGTYWLTVSLGRSPWLALFALPLAYSYPFYVGFVNWVASLALLVATLAAYISRLRGGLKGSVGGMILVLLPLACLATHVQPYTFFMAALAVMIIVFPTQRRSVLLCAAPSVLLATGWLLRQLATDQPGAASPRYIVFEPLSQRLSDFGHAVLEQFRDPFDTAFLVGFALMAAWALMLAVRASLRNTPRESCLMAIVSAGALGGYFLMPSHTHLMQFIHARYASLACLLLAVSVPLERGKVSAAWRWSLALLCAASSVYVGTQFVRFNAEVGDFRSLAGLVEENSCVASIEGYMDSNVMNDKGLYNHFAGYISLWRGALPGNTLAGMPHQPLAYLRRDGSPAAGYVDAKFPVILEHEPAQYIYRGTLYLAYGRFYRYFLVPKARDISELFGRYGSRLIKLGEAGPLALYINPAGTCGHTDQ